MSADLKQYPNCSIDLARVIEVRHESEPDKANALLSDGWYLLAAGIDAYGFPSLVLAYVERPT